MKQNSFFFIVLLMELFSCTGTRPSDNSSSNVSKIDSSQIFLALFPETTSENLHVYSPCDTTNGQLFSGTKINHKFYRFLKTNGVANIVPVDTFNHIYSCYKIKLSNNKTGLIVRRPSQYDESAIDLLIWDNTTNKIEDRQELADGYGDEGWYFIQDAWITDLDKNNFLDIITRRKDFNEDLDDSTKIPEIRDSLSILLGNDGVFSKAFYTVDTNKFQILNWTLK